MKKAKSQLYSFAFADVLSILSILHQSYFDVAAELDGYPRDSRKRDFALLTNFLLTKYAKSIQTLAPLSESAAQMICMILAMKPVDHLIDDCIDDLKQLS